MNDIPAAKFVFISQPMHGVSRAVIEATYEEAKSFLEEKGYEVAPSTYLPYLSEEARLHNHPEIATFGEDIIQLSNCDAIYMCRGWSDSRGCRLERMIAQEFELDIFYHNIPEDINHA